MLLNRLERAVMNNPVRGMIQQRVESRRMLSLGGPMAGGRALEMGCGSGIGASLVLERFGADAVDAFDLDPRMVARARRRLSRYGSRARVWVGDAAAVSVADATYDAVFDFGIIHHVPAWRRALAEVQRVLKPGGRFYGEEVLRDFLDHPLTRRLFAHPRQDRFDAAEFAQGLESVGLEGVVVDAHGRSFAWFTARKPTTP
jgi:ubiquinone/menaquinone biosynthesis C-methylase UbiE